MKTEKCYLILSVVIGIIGVSALGQIELPPHHDKPFLIGRAHPALSGIDKLSVAILPSGAEPNKDGLVWTELEAKVINKFNEAGIKITPGIAGGVLDIAELRVDVDMLKLIDSQKYVFCVQTSLSRVIYLVKKYKITSSSEPELILKADVWKRHSPMQAISVQDMPAKVTAVVFRHVEYFIEAYLAANPQDVQPGEAETSGTVSPTTPKEQIKPDAKSTVAEYRYVASKNSKVFHKPECRWAKRIKPENLVGYNSRDKAIEAGKRPCKLCKP